MYERQSACGEGERSSGECSYTPPMPILLTPIGVVRNGRTDPRDADWGALESRIVLAPEFRGGLIGLEAWSHVIVVTWLAGDPTGEPAPPDWRRRPQQRADLPRLGVFAQRGRLRPNPIGITTVAIAGLEREGLRVRGLDALDGTDVLDLKPHAAVFDRPRAALEPAWFRSMMPGYFHPPGEGCEP